MHPFFGSNRPDPDNTYGRQPSFGQMRLPFTLPTSDAAERLFLDIAERWYELNILTPEDAPMPFEADQSALACVLIAVDWAPRLTVLSLAQMRDNVLAAYARRNRAWDDALPWKLCLASKDNPPASTQAVQELTANLNHHNRSIRYWILRLAWCAHPWLERSEAVPRLLSNLEVGHTFSTEAAGLAARLCASMDQFCEVALSRQVAARDASRYKEAIDEIRERGIDSACAHLYTVEIECRKFLELRLINIGTERQATDSPPV